MIFTSNEYVGSGGRNASLAAILEGQGGQQKRQHISLKLSPIPFIMLYWSLRRMLSSGPLRAHWFVRIVLKQNALLESVDSL